MVLSPVQDNAAHRIVDNASRSNTIPQTELEILSWHIALHKRLSHNDQLLLDSFCKPQYSLFLLKDNEYLYTRSSAVIPFEYLKSNTQTGIDALFSNKYFSPDGRIFTILTYPVKSADSEKIILGAIVHSESENSTDFEQEFIKLAQSFSKIYRNIQNDISHVGSIVNTDRATLVIDRETGNIAAANNIMARLLHLTELELIDANFFDLHHIFSQVIPHHTIKMTNISSTTGSLAQVTLDDITKEKPKKIDPNMIITEQLANHLAHITLAISELKEQFSPSEKDISLFDTTMSELDKIDHFIKLYNLHNRIDDIPIENQHLLSQLEFAIHSLLDDQDVENMEPIETMTINAPRDSLKTVFESIITALQTIRHPGSMLTIRSDKNEKTVLTFSQTPFEFRNLKTFNDFLSLIKSIADTIGFSLLESIDRQKQLIEIKIIFK